MAKKSSPRHVTPDQLNPIIHERLRLGILSALVVQESLTFTELRDLLGATDGNLSVQARRLEDAGYVRCEKRFVGRKPKSTYRLSASGRTALEGYLETLSSLLPEAGAVRSAGKDGTIRNAMQPLPSHG